MTVRKGASLINIMVFVMFAMMVTAQVFFYTATSFEGLTDEREIMSYRLMLDSIVRLASADLASNDYNPLYGYNGKIIHNYVSPHCIRSDNVSVDYKSFYGLTQVIDATTTKSWDISGYSDKYHATIHDLDYSFSSNFDRETWIEDKDYNGANMYQKLFAAMPSEDVGGGGNWCRYYLLRAYAELPEKKFYGRKLMYQVLFRRDNEGNSLATQHKVYMQSFQEIWF